MKQYSPFSSLEQKLYRVARITGHSVTDATGIVCTALAELRLVYFDAIGLDSDSVLQVQHQLSCVVDDDDAMLIAVEMVASKFLREYDAR